ncbi:MAG: sarcosine oxidase subunit delta [Rhodospirillales bacterium]|nr:sarcosine oxidase subunit delta [Rhodospirillales bacterium]
MKILTCPLNGPRNIAEFTYGGEYRVPPDPDAASDRDWAEHVFFHDNPDGVVLEWWCHTASAFWFLVERDTRSDEILRVLRAEEAGAFDGAGAGDEDGESEGEGEGGDADGAEGGVEAYGIGEAGEPGP